MYIFAEDERVREELIRQKEFEADQRWLHKTIDEQRSLLSEKDRQIAVQDTLLNDKDKQIAVQDTLLNEQNKQIAELKAIIAEMKQKNS